MMARYGWMGPKEKVEKLVRQDEIEKEEKGKEHVRS